jgi:hypothetical protein
MIDITHDCDGDNNEYGHAEEDSGAALSGFRVFQRFLFGLKPRLLLFVNPFFFFRG